MIQSCVKTIEKYRLISKNDKLILGVSGGADSVCLLYLLFSLRKKYNLSLCVAHIDHGIRKNSNQDLNFVKNICLKLSVPFFSKRIKTSTFLSEQDARNIRFDYFAQLANKIKINKVALGHNLDDQAETILMRIIRGSGLQGLSGILPKRSINKLTIIRPLLETSRLEIEKYLNTLKTGFVTDSTNKTLLYLRNRVRNILLPCLAKYNPRIKESLNSLAQNSSLDYEFLETYALKTLKKVKTNKNSRTASKLSLKKLIKLHPAILGMILRFAYKETKGDLKRLTYQHLKELNDLIFNRPVNSIVHLPAKISVKKLKKSICFVK